MQKRLPQKVFDPSVFLASRYRFVAVLLSLSLFLPVKSDARSTEAQPKLLHEQPLELSPRYLLKQGVSGIVAVEVDIDTAGNPEQCKITRGVLPIVDSAVCRSMMRSTFTPAYAEGSPVASMVTFEYRFSPAAIAAQSSKALPELHGQVLVASNGQPLQQARVRLQFTGAETDSALGISREAYLATIGSVPGQVCTDGILETTTDATGAFAFRLLPSGKVRIAIIAPGYEIVHSECTVTPAITKKISCSMVPVVVDTGIDVVVYGQALPTPVIDIEEEMITTGLTRYVSDILLSNTTVRAVPESRSKMMVRSGTPFDNRYYIGGVPWLSPFHFSNHSFAESDGVMISALSNINLSIDNIAGKQLDASGFRIDMSPGIYRPAEKKLIRRPELSVDYNTLGQDFLLSVPVGRKKNVAQVGFTRCETYTLDFYAISRDSPNNVEYAAGLGNLTLTGVVDGNNATVKTFSWLGWSNGSQQQYQLGSPRDVATLPWGMSAVTIEPKAGPVTAITAGGSRQEFKNAQTVGYEKYISYANLRNGILTVLFDTLKASFAEMAFDVGTEVNHWDGLLELNAPEELDSGEQWWPSKIPNIYRTVTTASGSDYQLHLHTGVKKQTGPFTSTLDVLTAGGTCNDVPTFTADAGGGFSWSGERTRISLNGGRVTSRPDIRGLPSPHFRREQSAVYLLSLPAFWRPFRKLSGSVQPYLRYKDHEPYLDPFTTIWSDIASTRLYAAGVDADYSFTITDWLSIEQAFNISQARRKSGGAWENYEWDVPWTARGILHFYFTGLADLHFYLKGTASAGMPYFDYLTKKYARNATYKRIDISMQYRSKPLGERYFTRYEAYLNVFNATDQVNSSDCYYDTLMNAVPISQGPFMIEMGVKLAFRL